MYHIHTVIVYLFDEHAHLGRVIHEFCVHRNKKEVTTGPGTAHFQLIRDLISSPKNNPVQIEGIRDECCVLHNIHLGRGLPAIRKDVTGLESQIVGDLGRGLGAVVFSRRGEIPLASSVLIAVEGELRNVYPLVLQATMKGGRMVI